MVQVYERTEVLDFVWSSPSDFWHYTGQHHLLWVGVTVTEIILQFAIFARGIVERGRLTSSSNVTTDLRIHIILISYVKKIEFMWADGKLWKCMNWNKAIGYSLLPWNTVSIHGSMLQPNKEISWTGITYSFITHSIYFLLVTIQVNTLIAQETNFQSTRNKHWLWQSDKRRRAIY